MFKFLKAGLLLSGALLFMVPKARALPLDLPAYLVVDGTATQSVTLSTSSFPNTLSVPNTQAQWCLDRLTVSVPGNVIDTLTMYYSTSALTTGTTNYSVYLASGAVFDAGLDYREPYCAPVGDLLTISNTVSNAVVTFEGYIWGGWNAP